MSRIDWEKKRQTLTKSKNAGGRAITEIWHSEPIYNLVTKIKSVNASLYNRCVYRWSPTENWNKEHTVYEILTKISEPINQWSSYPTVKYIRHFCEEKRRKKRMKPCKKLWRNIWLLPDNIRAHFNNHERTISYRINIGYSVYFTGARKIRPRWNIKDRIYFWKTDARSVR